jgi:hypothetical protein
VGVIENMKEVADLVKQIGDIDLNRKIVNLEREVHDLTREKIRLETKLHEADQLLKLKQSLTFREPFYRLEGDNTPYCPACWEAGQKAVHVVFGFDNSETIRWDCPSCKHMYLLDKHPGRFRAPDFNAGNGPDS